MLECQKHKFNLEEHVIYLNGAYMSPNLKSVEQAGIDAVRQKNNPFTIQPLDFFDPVQVSRKLFAELIHLDDPDRIAIIPSVSYGMANVSKNINFSANDEILMIEEQFPSNYYCWKSCVEENDLVLKVIDSPSSSSRGQDWSNEIINAITDRTKVVTLPIVHWSDGTIFDIKTITEKAHAHNALVVIDGTQSIGAMEFDLNEIPVDALICAAYKWLLGPYSLGFAYYGPAFDNGKPIEESWMTRESSEDLAGLVSYSDKYQPKAFRYNVGQFSNFNLLPMAEAALRQLLEWTPKEISSYCASVSEPIHELHEEFDLEQPSWRANHLFGIRPKKSIDLAVLKQTMAEQNIYLSIRGDSIRISPNVYNTKEDLHILSGHLKKAINS